MADTDDVSRRKVLLGGAALGGAAAAGIGGLAAPASARAHPSAAAAAAGPGPAATVTPGDARYRDMISGSNGRWRAAPEAIRVPRTTAQVVDAVQEAVRAGKRIAVRSGGHCYEAFVYNADVEVVIDLSAMNDVHYDTDRRAFAVEAGCTLWEVYLELYRTWGVTIPGGTCGSVGAGGHVCGGGYGALCRQAGLTVDHLHAVEVVVVDAAGRARAVLATREDDDPHRELWWAHTGGGGGNFGIVTRYYFRTPGTGGMAPEKQLPRPPGEVYVHSQSWPWSDITEGRFRTLLRNYGAFFEEHSAPDSPYAGLFSMLVLSSRASGEISLSTQMDATRPDAAKLLEEFLAAIGGGIGKARPMTKRAGELRARPELFAAQKQSWLTATRAHAGTGWGGRGDYKSAYMRKGFPDAQIAALYKNLTETELTGVLVAVDSYGGAVNRVAEDATAVAQRDSILKLQYQAYWGEPDEEAAKLAWIRGVYRDVYADTGGVPVPGEVTDGTYINYPDIDLSDPEWNTSGVPWHDLYYKAGYPRLQQVKRHYDPGDVFRHTQSVR
ncbi:FAD-binding oxidoreductase [Streptomyces sp. A7024]|uniref:FAD-binding oxidoreductase n=1 Tax=Streptomyces coryli TaxID=1128680 RepID=A0A6G4TV07_9ACTN|nr:FAD-binding oxidoreductase [Streptomyces coryli]NGN63602.1 FAD-binding oxidoreductase [Streptomyces coryli]